MWDKNLLVFIRYFLIFMIVVGIITNEINIATSMIIFILIFIINNQIRFFSLNKKLYKAISFILELIFIYIAYKWIGGYFITYLILAAMDSTIIFEGTLRHILNITIIIQSILFTANENLEFKFINISLLILIISILYLIKDESYKKIKAQRLYDRLRLSEEKLKKANKDLEMYASSIEELTLLRERNRLSREIHDSVGHALSAIVVQLGAVERTVEKDPQASKEIIKALRKFTQNSLNEVRMSVRKIKPKEFEDYEGILMIEELVKNFEKITGVDVRLSFTKKKWPLSSDQSFILYRIIQEFLSNSIRHGKATLIEIFMSFNNYKVTVTLKDNGVGAENVIEGMGLKNMRERITEIGGNFDYITKSKEGFIVKVELNKVEKLKIHSQEESHGKY
ncbi:sensor histidine kinase [Dethiothermospora halolimnae]|uniref:sensor histidine kinase n=1 Tax=Dethiothermospora halolimnae TaxID=3114390 RepID=UPI003CCB7A50